MTRAPHTEPKPPGGEGPAARAAGPLRPARAAARARATGPHGVPPTTARTAPATITATAPHQQAPDEPGPAITPAAQPHRPRARHGPRHPPPPEPAVPPTTARTAPATITAAGPRKPAVDAPGPAGVTATRPRGSAARGRPTVLPRRGGAVDEAECPLAVYRR